MSEEEQTAQSSGMYQGHPPQAPQQGSDNKEAAPDGKPSWAQIARDPTQPDAPLLKPDEQVVRETNIATPRKQWSFEVKDAARALQAGQQIFLWAAPQMLDPFFALIHHHGHQYVYQLPEIIEHLRYGTPLPDTLQPSPVLDELVSIAKYLRLVCAHPYLAHINMNRNFGNQFKFLVCCCKTELEIVQSIKTMSWVLDTTEEQELVDCAFGEMSGIGSAIILFTLPGLRKICGAAEVFSGSTGGEDEVFSVQIRWLFVRDIPMHNLKGANYLKNSGHTYQVVEETTNEPHQPREGGNKSFVYERMDFNPEEYDGVRFYGVEFSSGLSALETIMKMSKNGGILLDFPEYLAAEVEERPAANLLCGGPRARPSVRGRGAARGGRGRGGIKSSFQPNNGGVTRGASRGARGSNSRGGRGRGGPSVAATSRPLSNRKVEASDGELVTLNKQYQFQIKHKKKTAPKDEKASTE